MHDYTRSHVSDQALLEQATAHLGDEHQALARLLADLAEIDARSLFLAAGYPSMYAYCVQCLHLSEQEAYDRILVARTARRHPTLFEAVAEGRLHLTAVRRLSAHLNDDNAAELIASASFKTKTQIEELIARWFPRLDAPTQVSPVAQVVPEQVAPSASTDQLVPEQVHVPAKVEAIAPERFVCQFTMSGVMRDKLAYAKALLSHAIPSGNEAEVIERALDELIERQEKRKFARGALLPRGTRSTTDARYIPAVVRAQVWERDGGQCTFFSESGHRCEERSRLEFDHVVEFARGGEATVDNLRLRCRPHNQYTAERTYGREFMRRKRSETRGTRTHEGAPAASQSQDPARREIDRDLLSTLRNLGYRNGDAQRALAHCATLPLETLEAALRAALAFLRPPARTENFAAVP